MNMKLSPEMPPKSTALLLAIEAFKTAQESLKHADEALKAALVPAAEYEKELPGDAAHPVATVIAARESVAKALRNINAALDYGLGVPSPLGQLAELRYAREDAAGHFVR